MARYQQEYELTRQLDLTGVICAYALETFQDTALIVFEDFGGESLDTLLNSATFTLLEIG